MNYICNQCGYGSASWMGRCPSCGVWQSFVEKKEDQETKKIKVEKLNILSLEKITEEINKNKKTTGIFEIDRVLGGGIVDGEIILLTGEPGVGKSTFLLQSLNKFRCLYISGEESTSQVSHRAKRLNINLKNILFSENIQVEGIIEGLKEMRKKIDVLLIDSIQTLFSSKIEAPTGSLSQIKEIATQIIDFAKKNNLPVIIVGHINKEGEVAGPKTLEHLVDCVLSLEGEKESNLRILRASKNRFGPTDEIGIFEMESEGLKPITNPLIFLENHEEKPGKAIVGITEGKRPLFFEIQTLTVPTVLAIPRRVVKGLDYNKVLLLLAVARKHLHLSLEKFDLFVNVVGGVNIKSTAADLGFIVSLVSSIKNQPPPKKSLFVGEVGLLGEIRKIYFQEKIEKEAERLGFSSVYSSKNIKNIKEIKSIFNF
jgi:DNA repair protein RadA/Sms